MIYKNCHYLELFVIIHAWSLLVEVLYPRLAWSECLGNSTRVVYLCVYIDFLCVNPETQVSVISFVILCFVSFSIVKPVGSSSKFGTKHTSFSTFNI